MARVQTWCIKHIKYTFSDYSFIQKFVAAQRCKNFRGLLILLSIFRTSKCWPSSGTGRLPLYESQTFLLLDKLNSKKSCSYIQLQSMLVIFLIGPDFFFWGSKRQLPREALYYRKVVIKCGPSATSISLTWELIINAIMKSHPRNIKLKTLGGREWGPVIMAQK